VSSTATSAATGFVLPGINFGIVPIGFYMFSAYWALFTAIMLWGAWNKRKVSTVPHILHILCTDFLVSRRISTTKSSGFKFHGWEKSLALAVCFGKFDFWGLAISCE
jgi:hypothetical protein